MRSLFLILIIITLYNTGCHRISHTPDRMSGETNGSPIEYTTDGFPTGHQSPEGIACDAVRAYIKSDHKLWLSTLVPPIYGPEGNKEYKRFKSYMIKLKKANKNDPEFPEIQIVKCYKARQFSANGPASAAYALGGFHGNMFVDIILSIDGEKFQRLRYHVMMNKSRRWYFEPRPDLCPLFSMGLNDESESTEEFKRLTQIQNHLQKNRI